MNESDNFDFPSNFKALTGHAPMSWQTRLYNEHFAKNDLPPVIDIPTGLGKTMVMAIWLIARANKLDVPTRLIYVVDRRTVVDQATDFAEQLQCKFGKDKLAISTLRGQLADNREWSRDPSRPAIIIGTVDLIGSALLFSGYRSGSKRHPLEAGLLGQDSLLVLDEAHLSKPFEKLICAINDEGRFQKDREGKAQGNPMRVIRMSATSGNSDDSKPFTLELGDDGELSGKDVNDPTITERFNAKKRLTITLIGEKDDLNKKLADAAIELAQKPDLVGKRIVAFVRKPDDARDIAEKIRTHAKSSKSKSNPDPRGPYAESVEVLTGTMRGLERDELVKKPVLKRFLDGDENPFDCPNQRPVFLVSTSAGEVGFDLNADHLVGDAAPLDSWIQRLGRVNRRGKGDAQIHLFVEPPKKDKNGKPKKLEGLDLAIANTVSLLQGVTDKDVSPKNIAALKSNEWKDKYNDACSPEPATVDLTDILVDAWSMTSITAPMPGRPEVGPWLRGIGDQQAQTTIAWRAELELFCSDPEPEKALQAIFIRHPIRPHESLTVNTGYLLDFLKRISKLKDRPSDLQSTRAAVRFPRGQVVCRTLQQLADEPGILYAESTLILPAKFGGLDPFGMLDAESIPKVRKDDELDPPSLDVADRAGYEQIEAARSRLRIVIERSENGSWTPKPIEGLSIPEDIELESTYDTSSELFDAFKAANLRVRLVQPIKFDDENDAVRSLVILASAPKKKNKEDQLLDAHVSAVEAEARRIAKALSLAENDPIRVALLFAAKWHDEGKKARIWQVFANNSDPDGSSPLGKMAQSRHWKSLYGYRHEFGSLLRIHHPDRCGTAECDLPTDPDAHELALHLIATHHGAGRPHFGPGQYHPFKTVEVDAIHTAAIRRFARLQRKYGWWYLAWLENLLRCADAMASADDEATEMDELEETEQ